MSDDVMSWNELKKLDLRNILDKNLADIENMEDVFFKTRAKLENVPDGSLKDILQGALKFLSETHKTQRITLIMVNALREGLIEIENQLEERE